MILGGSFHKISILYNVPGQQGWLHHSLRQQEDPRCRLDMHPWNYLSFLIQCHRTFHLPQRKVGPPCDGRKALHSHRPWRRKHPFYFFLSHKVFHMIENFVAKSPKMLPKLLLLFVVALLEKSQKRSWWDPIRIFCLVVHYIWCWGIQKNEKDYHLKSKLVQILPPLGEHIALWPLWQTDLGY